MQGIITCVCARAHGREITSRASAHTKTHPLTHTLTFFLHHWRPSCCSISVDFLTVTFYAQLVDIQYYIHEFVNLKTREKKNLEIAVGKLKRGDGDAACHVTYQLAVLFRFVALLGGG